MTVNGSDFAQDWTQTNPDRSFFLLTKHGVGELGDFVAVGGSRHGPAPIEPAPGWRNSAEMRRQRAIAQRTLDHGALRVVGLIVAQGIGEQPARMSGDRVVSPAWK